MPDAGPAVYRQGERIVTDTDHLRCAKQIGIGDIGGGRGP